MGALIFGIALGYAVFAIARSWQLAGLKIQPVDAVARATHCEHTSADLLPPASVLDDVAECFHAEAGTTLKAARAESKRLVKAGAAAACDYVEAERRATACAFVVDACDGKAEAIFAIVEAENHGTLASKTICGGMRCC